MLKIKKPYFVVQLWRRILQTLGHLSSLSVLSIFVQTKIILYSKEECLFLQTQPI